MGASPRARYFATQEASGDRSISATAIAASVPPIFSAIVMPDARLYEAARFHATPGLTSPPLYRRTEARASAPRPFFWADYLFDADKISSAALCERENAYRPAAK